MKCFINWITFCVSLLEQFCTNSVNVYQGSNDEIGDDMLAIIQPHNFTCNGRIINIRARVRLFSEKNNYPFFQVWRPTSVNATVYNKIGEAQFQSDDQMTVNRYNVGVANVVLTSNNTIEFQSGDVVGYYHPRESHYRVRTIRTDGYIQYQFSGSHKSVDLNINNGRSDRRQPLIQLTVGK